MRRLPALVGPAAIALVVASFLVLKAFALLVHPSDEGIYFYGALRWSEGALPYRDFFFAHPPLHLAPLALLFKIAGYHFALAKSWPFLMAALQGVCAWLCVRRLAADSPPPAREAAALAAAATLLFSESLLKASSHATGINQTSGLLALGATLLVYRRPLAAGLATGAAVMTLLQGAPVATVLGASVIGAAWLRGARRLGTVFRAGDLRRFVGASLGLLALVHVVFLSAAGGRFLDGVYRYHLAKIDRPGEGLRQLGFVLHDNWTLWVGAAAGIAASIAAGGPRRRVALAALAAIVVQIVAMASRPRVFPFYFQPAFFPAAVGLGLGLATVAFSLARPGGLLSRSTAAGIAGLALLALTVLRQPLAGAISPKRAETLRAYAQNYVWTDAPGIGPLNAVVRALFWQNGRRAAGNDYNAVTQYVWQASRWIDVQPALVEAVKLLARDRPDTVLFGDSTSAPQIALDAGVRIAGDLVDTNMERFRAGTLRFSDVADLIGRTPDVLVLLNPSDGIGSLPEMRAYVAAHVAPAAELTSCLGERYVIYRRRP